MSNQLPNVVWDNSTLHLPPELVEAHAAVLTEMDLLAAAMDANFGSGSVGGSSLSETREHFVTRFGVGAARVQALVMDPEKAFTHYHKDILSTFSDGPVPFLMSRVALELQAYLFYHHFLFSGSTICFPDFL